MYRKIIIPLYYAVHYLQNKYSGEIIRLDLAVDSSVYI